MTLSEATCKICPFGVTVKGGNCIGKNCMAWMDTTKEPVITDKCRDAKAEVLKQRRKYVEQGLASGGISVDPMMMFLTGDEMYDTLFDKAAELLPFPKDEFKAQEITGYCVRLKG